MNPSIKTSPTRLLPQGPTRNLSTTFGSYRPQYFPALFISLALLCVALQRTPHTSKVINFAAAGTFGVYCIHQYPWCNEIAKHLLAYNDSVLSLRGYQRILLRMAAGVAVFVAAVLFDALRRLLFNASDKLFATPFADTLISRIQRWIRSKFAVFTSEKLLNLQTW